MEGRRRNFAEGSSVVGSSVVGNSVQGTPEEEEVHRSLREVRMLVEVVGSWDSRPALAGRSRRWGKEQVAACQLGAEVHLQCQLFVSLTQSDIQGFGVAPPTGRAMGVLAPCIGVRPPK